MNKVKKALLERKVSFGSWLQTESADSAEIMADSDFEWLAIDCEHTSITIADASSMIRAMELYGTIPFVRVEKNEALAIRKMLDAGARGIIVPLVNNAEDAKTAVSYCKYPPCGVRGFAFCRANKYGKDFDKYVKEANADISVLVMIETKEAVKNIDSILKVEGVDGIFIGPYDLSGSYGVPGELENPAVKNGIKKVIDACKKQKKTAGIHIVKPEEKKVKELVKMGYTFIALGMDTIFLRDGMAVAWKGLTKNSRKN